SACTTRVSTSAANVRTSVRAAGLDSDSRICVEGVARLRNLDLIGIRDVRHHCRDCGPGGTPTATSIGSKIKITANDRVRTLGATSTGAAVAAPIRGIAVTITTGAVVTVSPIYKGRPSGERCFVRTQIRGDLRARLKRDIPLVEQRCNMRVVEELRHGRVQRSGLERRVEVAALPDGELDSPNLATQLSAIYPLRDILLVSGHPLRLQMTRPHVEKAD